MLDVLIVGGGAAGLSCAMILGSAHEKPFAKQKRIAILMHQKSSQLQSALLNNVLGLPNNGPKSVMAPTPIKISKGATPLAMATL